MCRCRPWVDLFSPAEDHQHRQECLCHTILPKPTTPAHVRPRAECHSTWLRHLTHKILTGGAGVAQTLLSVLSQGAAPNLTNRLTTAPRLYPAAAGFAAAF